MIDRILICCCLFFSFLNIIFTIFLSNSIFRLITDDEQKIIKKSNEKNNPQDGLVDIKPTVTYDPRFRNQ